MKLLKDIELYTPVPEGRKDVLIAGGIVAKIAGAGELDALESVAQVFPCGEFRAFPGIVDQHIHLIGGGGEEGPASCLPELPFGEIVSAGITTVVGVLGADSRTKSLRRLCARAAALEAQGLSAYMYTGSYAVPPPTLTGSVADDLLLIDRVLGVGEIAIADHRASMASRGEMARLAAEAHNGGLLSGKAGVVHLHVGDGRDGLDPLLRLLDETELPAGMFVPTHVNRSERLFRQAVRYWKNGGTIDLTAGETAGVPVADALARLLSMKADLARVTVSSDAGGSSPAGGPSQCGALYADIKRSILETGAPPEVIFRTVTENVSKVLRLAPAKGMLNEGSDADILLIDGDSGIAMVFSRGTLVYGRADGPDA